jgi:hypothetical protein
MYMEVNLREKYEMRDSLACGREWRWKSLHDSGFK